MQDDAAVLWATTFMLLKATPRILFCIAMLFTVNFFPAVENSSDLFVFWKMWFH